MSTAPSLRHAELEPPRAMAWSLASVVKLTLGLLALSGLLGTALGIFIYLFPHQSAECFAWLLQKLCDLLSGRRC